MRLKYNFSSEEPETLWFDLVPHEWLKWFEKLILKRAQCPSLANSAANSVSVEKIVNVMLLGSKTQLAWKQNPSALEIDLPREKPCEDVFCLKIELQK